MGIMITLEELLNLVAYFTVIAIFIVAVQNVYLSVNAYKKTVSIYNNKLENQLLYNTYINTYRVKGTKYVSIDGIMLRGTSGRVKVDNSYISLLNIGGDNEPY